MSQRSELRGDAARAVRALSSGLEVGQVSARLRQLRAMNIPTDRVIDSLGGTHVLNRLGLEQRDDGLLVAVKQETDRVPTVTRLADVARAAASVVFDRYERPVIDQDLLRFTADTSRRSTDIDVLKGQLNDVRNNNNWRLASELLATRPAIQRLVVSSVKHGGNIESYRAQAPSQARLGTIATALTTEPWAWTDAGEADASYTWHGLRVDGAQVPLVRSEIMLASNHFSSKEYKEHPIGNERTATFMRSFALTFERWLVTNDELPDVFEADVNALPSDAAGLPIKSDVVADLLGFIDDGDATAPSVDFLVVTQSVNRATS